VPSLCTLQVKVSADGFVTVIVDYNTVVSVKLFFNFLRLASSHSYKATPRDACGLVSRTRPEVLDCEAMVRPPDPVLLGYLGGYDPHVSRLALAVREVVLEEAPEAIESISRGYATVIGFSFTGKPLKDGFCHVVTYSSSVNLGFNRGALLPDPNRELAGSGKLIRHITIRNERDLDRQVIRRFLQAAIEQVTRTPTNVSRRASKRAKPSKR